MTPRSLREWRHWSIRSKILLTVFAGAILPLGILGVWLTSSAERSGRELLRAASGELLVSVGEQISETWQHRESDLRLLAANDELIRLLRSDHLIGPDSAAERVLRAVFDRQERPDYVILRDAAGSPRWRVFADAADIVRVEIAGVRPTVTSASAGIVSDLLILDPITGRPVGTLQARWRFSSLLRRPPQLTGGAVLGAVDRRTGEIIVPTPFHSTALSREVFNAGSERWLNVRHVLTEPPIDLILSSPLSAYTGPFLRTARRGLLALSLVSACVLIAVTIATRRITHSLENVAGAAKAVTMGDLHRRLEVESADEVGELARAFNTMADSLQHTLRELSHREALAAVGEFASSLAHEVRNPLTSIRLDLQLVAEKLATDAPARKIVARTLIDIERLDRTVSGALRVARSGNVSQDVIDLRMPLEAALKTAGPEFLHRGATLEWPAVGPDQMHIQGDSSALTQMFLNVLLNAAQALQVGGRAGVRAQRNGVDVVVSIWDHGPGIGAEALTRVFEPFYSTKENGTGLGLSISRRIATAHAGRIDVESAPGAGTTFHIRFPLAMH